MPSHPILSFLWLSKMRIAKDGTPLPTSSASRRRAHIKKRFPYKYNDFGDDEEIFNFYSIYIVLLFLC